MHPLMIVYVPYAVIAVGLTIWLARALSRHGEVFLFDVFPERHDLARAAHLSLGAAYYYFPSKEALVFAFYEANQDDIEAREATITGTLRERLGALFHAKLDSIRDQRKMLAAIIQRLVDPGDPLSAFSARSRAVRDRAIAVLARTLAAGGIPAEVVPIAAHGLWLFQLASMLIFVNDDSADQVRSHGLIDDGLDLVVPMLPVLATPMGRARDVAHRRRLDAALGEQRERLVDEVTSRGVALAFADFAGWFTRALACGHGGCGGTRTGS